MGNVGVWETQERRQWEYFDVGTIRSLTVGVAGLGEIGSEIARALRLLGADVVGWRRSRTDDPSIRKLFVGKDELPAFAQACHVVVLALPLTRDTKGLFDGNVLGHFRKGSHLINVGRGAVLDEAALLSALSDGRIGQATLDVFATEPLPSDHPFWSHPNIAITPHVCGPLVPEDVVPHFVRNYVAFATGKPLMNVIDVTRQY